MESKVSVSFFKIPHSKEEISSRLILIKSSNILTAAQFLSLKDSLNNNLSDSSLKKPNSPIYKLSEALKISDNEYAILHALNEIKILIQRSDPKLFILIDDEYKYFERVMLLNTDYQGHPDLDRTFDPQQDIEIDDEEFRRLELTLDYYKAYFAKKIRAKLAVLEILATIEPLKFIPELLNISLKYLNDPLTAKTILNCRRNIFLKNESKLFIKSLCKCLQFDSRKNQAKKFSHWQISSEYQKYLEIIPDLKKMSKKELDLDSCAYIYFSTEQCSEIISGQKISNGDLAISIVMKKYKIQNHKIIREANTATNKFFENFFESIDRPSLRAKYIDKLKYPIEYYMDQFFSRVTPRDMVINYIESL